MCFRGATGKGRGDGDAREPSRIGSRHHEREAVRERFHDGNSEGGRPLERGAVLALQEQARSPRGRGRKHEREGRGGACGVACVPRIGRRAARVLPGAVGEVRAERTVPEDASADAPEGRVAEGASRTRSRHREGAPRAGAHHDRTAPRKRPERGADPGRYSVPGSVDADHGDFPRDIHISGERLFSFRFFEIRRFRIRRHREGTSPEKLRRRKDG